MNRGLLIGVGVGPGRPELVTYEAVEALKGADVITYPIARPGGPSRALRTVEPYLPKNTPTRPLVLPMTYTPSELEQARIQAVQILTEETKQGATVAFLCLGDPLFYGTFGYLMERFDGPVRVVSGVTSVSAATAMQRDVLVESNQCMVTLPDGGNLEQVRWALGGAQRVVIMKPSRLTQEVKDFLAQQGHLQTAYAVRDIGGKNEQIYLPVTREVLDELSYFSILFLRGGQG